jgi:hypothetical protein
MRGNPCLNKRLWAYSKKQEPDFYKNYFESGVPCPSLYENIRETKLKLNR